MNNRRSFLKTSILGAGAVALNPYLNSLHAGSVNPNSGSPRRFIFIRKCNGMRPDELALPSFSDREKAKEKSKEAFEVDLDTHELPFWLGDLNEYKENLTILQGLSSKMSENGHSSYSSVMGCFNSHNNQLSSIKRATIDFELGNLFPTAFRHVEVSYAQNRSGIVSGYSAPGSNQRNFCYADPRTTYNNLFKTVLNPDVVKSDIQMLEYAKGRESALRKSLSPKDDLALKNHLESIEATRQRNIDLLKMTDVIKKHMPGLGSTKTRVDQQNSTTDMIAAALAAGLTNSVTYTIDDLRSTYTGIRDAGPFEIDLHGLGHNQAINNHPATKIRAEIRIHHVTQIKTIIDKLKAQPEGSGTMFDNTMIMYFAEGGETHHGTGVELPIVIMSGKNCKLDIAGRYIRLPYHGKKGHQTLGNWYTTLLNAHGNPIEHYGDLDATMGRLNLPQKGAIKQFLA